MALVDGKGRFLWASCGQPGSCHDSTLLQSTELWNRLHDICHLRTVALGDVRIPSLILGDGAFPFRTFLMKRFSQAHLSNEQKIFNKKHSSARVSVENAFGVLKARFRVLTKTCESRPDNLTYICLSCIVLHNILVSTGEAFNIVEGIVARDFIQRHAAPHDNGPAIRVRDALVPLVQ